MNPWGVLLVGCYGFLLGDAWSNPGRTTPQGRAVAVISLVVLALSVVL